MPQFHNGTCKKCIGDDFWCPRKQNIFYSLDEATHNILSLINLLRVNIWEKATLRGTVALLKNNKFFPNSKYFLKSKRFFFTVSSNDSER
jgi:hypothetical protein